MRLETLPQAARGTRRGCARPDTPPASVASPAARWSGWLARIRSQLRSGDWQTTRGGPHGPDDAGDVAPQLRARPRATRRDSRGNAPRLRPPRRPPCAARPGGSACSSSAVDAGVRAPGGTVGDDAVGDLDPLVRSRSRPSPTRRNRRRRGARIRRAPCPDRADSLTTDAPQEDDGYDAESSSPGTPRSQGSARPGWRRGDRAPRRSATSASTSKVSVPTSTVARGLATRLWYQSGLVGAPALEANTASCSPSAQVHDRCRPLLSCLRSGGREQQERGPGELTSHLAARRAEFLDDLLVPVVVLAHRSSFLGGT